MKTALCRLLLAMAGAAAVIISPAGAATISWTNTSGGNWSAPANWSPNHAPGSGDDAVITANGSYTVTLDTSPTLDSLTLGGSSGQQTLSTAGNTLTLTNASGVSHNGVLALSGGTLAGSGLLTVNGQLYWTAGEIDGVCSVATNGVLVLAGASGGTYDIYGTVTNAGTVALESGTLRLVNGISGVLVNLPGGVVELTTDVSIINYGSRCS